jgi:hypothetical protein
MKRSIVITRKILLVCLGLLTLVGVVASCGGSSSEGSGEPKAKAKVEAEANIFVVKSKSFCTATGVSDLYTGEGKVEFFYTLRNTGAKDGEIDLQPIRVYDDGERNESVMDMSSGNKVPAHSTVKLRTPQFKYKAHEHEVASCAVKAGDDEVPLRVVR